MSLTGILLDVSGSMEDNIGSGTDEEGGPWAHSIFKVIDDLIKHDLTSENRVFAIGVGASCGKEIFDVIGTVQKIENLPSATEDHINEVFGVLERNGARNIRKWANDVTLIQETVSDYMAKLVLRKLQSDKQFLSKFVYEFLPPGCRDITPEVSKGLNDFVREPNFGGFGFVLLAPILYPVNLAEDAAITGISSARHATREVIHEIIKKAKSYLLKDIQQDALRFLIDVGTDSIFSVQDASSIIRGYVNVDEKDLSAERKQELLENVEPFIYGATPLYESLEKATKLFEKVTSDKKLLFVLSDGEPTDGSIYSEDRAKINQITSKLTEADVKIVSCFITKSTDIHPKRLYDKMPLYCMDRGATFLFSLSSEVPTQLLPRAILVKRGWTIDVTSNETKLFVQVNHPDNLREACEMAKYVVCSSDALSEFLVSVDLDIYINHQVEYLEAKDQGKKLICYALASATVLHLAMQRIHGREDGCPNFNMLKDEMISKYGTNEADTSKVLQEICPKYRLRCRDVSFKGAMKAIVEKRPVVAKFRLTKDEWKIFRNFYRANPTGILTQNELDVRKRPKKPPPSTIGHAVVLTSYNSKCLTFMNSWGHKFADHGFFSVQNAKVLFKLEFIDVYWTLDDLTDEEKESYRKHGSEVAEKLMESLKGLQKAEYTCPECKETSLVTQFTGTLSKVQCPKCLREFSTNDNAGNILALNIYLTSLSR